MSTDDKNSSFFQQWKQIFRDIRLRFEFMLFVIYIYIYNVIICYILIERVKRFTKQACREM